VRYPQAQAVERAELFKAIAQLQQQIDAAEGRLSRRQRFALALSVLGATLLLLANLVVEHGESNQPSLP
jgi:hypothetical protein